jgi:hypothetical protein
LRNLIFGTHKENAILPWTAADVEDEHPKSKAPAKQGFLKSRVQLVEHQIRAVRRMLPPRSNKVCAPPSDSRSAPGESHRSTSRRTTSAAHPGCLHDPDFRGKCRIIREWDD